MERELVFVGLSSALAICATWTVAIATFRSRRAAVTSEVGAFWRVVAPVLAAAAVLAFFVGWAVQEPDPADEWLEAGFWGLSAATAIVVLRATARGLSALRIPPGLPVGVVGLFRPRVVVSEAFGRGVDESVLRAALAHEAAHVRHRDPLRIWLVAFATDLQWPLPGARSRFESWLLALEVERDDEALARGATRGALAEAILAAARLTRGPTRTAVAAVGSEPGVALRMRRLLGGGARPRVRDDRRWAPWVVGSGLLFVAWLGHGWGDALLAVLPGVGR
ncbi:MAG: M56 family metallopeptidase [Myxococcota bacterium]|nr:M56 family metallopeptidase [Myxococcota bacterium]